MKGKRNIKMLVSMALLLVVAIMGIWQNNAVAMTKAPLEDEVLERYIRSEESFDDYLRDRDDCDYTFQTLNGSSLMIGKKPGFNNHVDIIYAEYFEVGGVVEKGFRIKSSYLPEEVYPVVFFECNGIGMESYVIYVVDDTDMINPENTLKIMDEQGNVLEFALGTFAFAFDEFKLDDIVSYEVLDAKGERLVMRQMQ